MLSQLLVMEWNVTYPIGWLKTLGGIDQIMDLLRSKEELDIVALDIGHLCQDAEQTSIHLSD